MPILRLLGLGGKSPQAKIDTISVTEAHNLVSDGSVLLIDVRQPEEWADTGKPLGSVGISLGDKAFVDKVKSAINEKLDTAIAVSCRTGGRSSEAAKRLRSAGLTNIRNVEGGILAWLAANLPTA